MPKFVIGKTYSFAAAHHLPEHDGKCRRPHGHNYRVEVEVSGEKQRSGPKNGMVLDFGVLDEIMQPHLDQLDHYDLNHDLWEWFGTDSSYGPPTAEGIAQWIAAGVISVLPIYADRVELERVRVWETDKCYAEWRRD